MRPPTDFPRAPLSHRPTPLEPMTNLARHLSTTVRLHVKRDDCTGLAMGGNKVRQLEFYLGEAQAAEATTILITGAVQSNFVRCAAAAAAKLGLRCHVQLEDRVHDMDATYHSSGNALLDRLFGAVVHAFPEGEDETGADRALDAAASRLREQGERPYVVHLSPEHPPLGALAYVEAASEIIDQATEQGWTPDAVVVASGSAATHAGLLVGLRSQHQDRVAVHGICVRRPRTAQRPRVLRCAGATETLLNSDTRVTERDVITHDDFLGPGYGRLNAETRSAIQLAARTEGLLLDPVYTGKAFAGLIALTRAEAFRPEANVVFVHTGGTPALFAYGSAFME